MKDAMEAAGMVLSAMPVGEYDKRVVLLTKQLGRITAFARGARRQNSPLLASTRPFTFGTFSLFPGRSSYTLQGAEITEYFEGMGTDLDAVSYGCYFSEVAEYYTRENVDESQMLNLLYVSLKALQNPRIPNPLVRRIYELRAMVINGEYPQVFSCLDCRKELTSGIYIKHAAGMVCMECAKKGRNGIPVHEAALYALQYVVSAPLPKLYRFTLKPEAFEELERVVKCGVASFIDKNFRSLRVLEALQNEKNPVK